MGYYLRARAKVRAAVRQDEVDQTIFDEAIADLDRAIELNPQDPIGYYYRAYYYPIGNQPGKYEKAIIDYGRAIEIAPKFVGAYFNRARAKRALEQYTAAIEDYDAVIELYPYANALDERYSLPIDSSLAVVYHLRGQAKSELGLIEEAQEDFDIASDLEAQRNS